MLCSSFALEAGDLVLPSGKSATTSSCDVKLPTEFLAASSPAMPEPLANCGGPLLALIGVRACRWESLVTSGEIENESGGITKQQTV